MATTGVTEDERRRKAKEEYRRKLIEHRELDAKLKKSECHMAAWKEREWT